MKRWRTELSEEVERLCNATYNVKLIYCVIDLTVGVLTLKRTLDANSTAKVFTVVATQLSPT